jgi:peptide/nickel transport system permease protein
MLGQDATPESADVLRRELGLDLPIPVQYLRWLSNTLHGDLGQSIRTREPVIEALASRLPVTIELSILALCVGLSVGLAGGIFGATQRNAGIELARNTLELIGLSLPTFFVGILLILALALWLRILPPSGFVPITRDPLGNLQLMAMPTLSLGLGLAAMLARMTRSSVREVMASDFVRTGRAKGLHERAVLQRHALRNALLPILTITGLQAGTLLGGAVLTETIFSLPGLGRLIVDAIFARDLPVIQGAVLFVALIRVASSVLTDIAYSLLDPRIRSS